MYGAAMGASHVGVSEDGRSDMTDWGSCEGLVTDDRTRAFSGAFSVLKAVQLTCDEAANDACTCTTLWYSVFPTGRQMPT